MEAPVFVGAGAGAERLTTGNVTVSKTDCVAGNLVILDMAVNGNTGDWSGWGSVSNIQTLAGVANTLDFPINVLSRQICMGRVTADGTVSASIGAGASGEDVAGRIYEFSGESAGTTMATVLENGGSTNTETAGTSTTVADADVTTNGVLRLALQLVALRSSQTIGPFTGESGGDWGEAVAEYLGTTQTLQLQTASMPSPGLIDGGTLTIVSTTWQVFGTAIIPMNPAAVAADYSRFPKSKLRV